MVWIDHQIGEAPRPLGSDWVRSLIATVGWLGGHFQGVNTLIASVDKVQMVAMHGVGTTAVFMHTTLMAKRWCEQILMIAVEGLAHNDVAPSVPRPSLDPE